MAEVQHPNRLLAALPAADFELLRPHLKPFDLVHGDVLYDAGDVVNWVYFPHSGVISLVVGLADGQRIEAAMVGRDSVAGASAGRAPRSAVCGGIGEGGQGGAAAGPAARQIRSSLFNSAWRRVHSVDLSR